VGSFPLWDLDLDVHPAAYCRHAQPHILKAQLGWGQGSMSLEMVNSSTRKLLTEAQSSDGYIHTALSEKGRCAAKELQIVYIPAPLSQNTRSAGAQGIDNDDRSIANVHASEPE